MITLSCYLKDLSLPGSHILLCSGSIYGIETNTENSELSKMLIVSLSLNQLVEVSKLRDQLIQLFVRSKIGLVCSRKVYG